MGIQTIAATKQLFTVEDVAERLNLHVKMVRRFIHEGRLPARRIGKEYRITRTALEESAGAPAYPVAVDVPRTRQVLVSSIVDIDAIGPEDSRRITTLIMAGINARRGEPDFPRVDSLYDVERARLRPDDHGEPDADIRPAPHDRRPGCTLALAKAVRTRLRSRPTASS